tara:strand:+ start:155 stop:1975 length:1821 start_codon:yes stop_codon:yes gene_type:complete
MRTYFHIMSYSKKYSISIIFALLASILFTVFNTLAIWMVSSLISTILKGNKIDLNSSDNSSFIGSKLEMYINNLIAAETPLEQLKLVCIFLFITFIFKNIFFYINQTLLSYINLNIIKDMRDELYIKIQNLPLNFFDRNKSGELLSILLNDINAIRVAFTKSFQILFSDIINILFLLFMLFITSKKLTLIVFAAIPVSAFVIIMIGRSIRRKAMRSSFKIADISNIIQEMFMGIKIIKAFNMKKNEIKKFLDENYNYSQLLFRQAKLLNLSTPINDFIGVVIAVILLWYGGKEVLVNNNISSDGFIRYIMFLFAMLQPSRRLGTGIATIQSGIASANRVKSVLDIEIDNSQIGTKDIINFKNKIHFSNVDFKYDQSKKYALKNINISINKGDKIALVGKSGSGKTTFSNLLLRYYNPTNGEIFIDDYNITDLTKFSLRKIMSVVTQDPILFNDTINNNITYGSENSSNSNIKSASISANADSFINLLSKKYETVIGERGTKLSGGEKQRLSIARAIYRNPEILILDEATSSLDTESEKQVQKAIDNLIEDRTVIIIAHRLSTIINCDKILVFENGEIKEVGNHKELIKQNKLYKKLYDLQFEVENE